MGEHGGVWVFSEDEDLLLELLAGGKPLAEHLNRDLVALSFGGSSDNEAVELIRSGADKVLSVADPKLVDFHVETCLDAITQLAEQNLPNIILLGSTKNGKELAARLAARLEVGCTPDCTQLMMNEEDFLVTKRVVYSGNAVVTATYQKTPQIATIPPRTFEKLNPQQRDGEVVRADVELGEPKVKVDSVNEIAASDVKIEEANIVICGGRGVEKKDDFQPLRELASLLGGQVGNTRPLAEDRRWFTQWVGLSGKKIKPTLYVGCGISGMIQHVAGMRDSQIVVAINKDPEAAIFEMADYIVVGDLYDMIPAIVQALKKKLKS